MSVFTALRRAGVPDSIARAEAPRAERAMIEHAITTQARARDFLAQVLHESAGLHYFEEIASGAGYEGRTDLGNVHVGDGKRYKGRGPIQLTGRANYRAYGAKLKLDLEAHPELAARHDIGWRIAALYWQDHGLNQLADRGDFLQITKRINGGTNGLASRLAFRDRLKGVDCRPKASEDLSVFTSFERRLIREYDILKRANRNHPRQVMLRNAMTKQRKKIWLQGENGSGWDQAHRRTRYHALLLRTR